MFFKFHNENKIETITFLYNNKIIFEELGVFFVDKFTNIYKENGKNTDTFLAKVNFKMNKKELNSFINKVSSSTNYQKAGVKGDFRIIANIIKDEKFTFEYLVKVIPFIILESNNDFIIFDRNKVNEIFEEYTSISFKNPIEEIKTLLSRIESQKHEPIDNDGVLKLISNNLKLGISFEKSVNFKFFKDNKFISKEIKELIENNNSIKFLKKNESSLKGIQSNLAKHLYDIRKSIQPLIKQLESRSNTILEMVKKEDDTEIKRKIINNFYNDLRDVRPNFFGKLESKTSNFINEYNLRETIINRFLGVIISNIEESGNYSSNVEDELLINRKLFRKDIDSLIIIYRNIFDKINEKREELELLRLFDDIKKEYLGNENDSKNIINNKIKKFSLDFFNYHDNENKTILLNPKKEVKNKSTNIYSYLEDTKYSYANRIEETSIINKPLTMEEIDKQDKLNKQLELDGRNEEIKIKKIASIANNRFNILLKSIIEKQNNGDFNNINFLIEKQIELFKFQNDYIDFLNLNEYLELEKNYISLKNEYGNDFLQELYWFQEEYNNIFNLDKDEENYSEIKFQIKNKIKDKLCQMK